MEWITSWPSVVFGSAGFLACAVGLLAERFSQPKPRPHPWLMWKRYIKKTARRAGTREGGKGKYPKSSIYAKGEICQVTVADLRRATADMPPDAEVLLHYGYDIPVSRTTIQQILYDPDDEYFCDLNDNYSISSACITSNDEIILEAGTLI